MFEKCFESPYYLHFDEFTFLFLLFFIIYCKFVNKSITKARKKFFNKKKSYKFDVLTMLDKPILVCSGWDSNDNRVGDILLTNVAFRKYFTYSSTKNPFGNRSISELIVNQEQIINHYHLMNESGKFSDNQIKKLKHNDYHCFIKTNLETEKFNLFK